MLSFILAVLTWLGFTAPHIRRSIVSKTASLPRERLINYSLLAVAILLSISSIIIALLMYRERASDVVFVVTLLILANYIAWSFTIMVVCSKFFSRSKSLRWLFWSMSALILTSAIVYYEIPHGWNILRIIDWIVVLIGAYCGIRIGAYFHKRSMAKRTSKH